MCTEILDQERALVFPGGVETVKPQKKVTSSECLSQDESYGQMEVSDKDRQVALTRSAEVKALDDEYFKAKEYIPTGLKLGEHYRDNRERILKALGGTEEDWNDYRWHLKKRISSVDILGKIVYLTEKEREEVLITGKQYRWGISPYYASLMDPEDRFCPIRKQAVPSIMEHIDTSEIQDPMIIKYNSPAPLISRLYPDRLIINVTNGCAMFCRHCLRRKDIDFNDVTYPQKMLEQALEYVRLNPEIRDVLLTGGDALLLSDKQLDHILTELDHIPHVEIKRLGSRMPCVLPQRITTDLCRMLAKHDPVFLSTQFNHPKEITSEARKAVDMLTKSGVIVRDQTVLLKGINDDVSILRRLFHALLRIRVRPYYLYQCDPITGSAHFRTTVERGLAIIGGLRGHTTGFAVPTYVIDAPGGGGKIPLLPEYVMERDDDQLVARNYLGKKYRHPVLD